MRPARVQGRYLPNSGGNTGLSPLTVAVAHLAAVDCVHHGSDFNGVIATSTAAANKTTTPRIKPNTAPSARSAGRRPATWNSLLTSQIKTDPAKTAAMNTSTNAPDGVAQKPAAVR